jgi:hypothetical protein
MSARGDYWVTGEELEQFQDRLHRYITANRIPPTRLSIEVIGNSAIHRALCGRMVKRTTLDKYCRFMNAFPDGRSDMVDSRNFGGRKFQFGDKAKDPNCSEDEVMRRRIEREEERKAHVRRWLQKERETAPGYFGNMLPVEEMPA